MIKIGIVGANELSKRHISRFAEIPEFELVGLFDHNEENAKSITEENGITYFSQLDSMMDLVDAVDILSPVGTHYKYASNAIMHSKHVLLNGLISEDIREARSLNELAIEANVNLKILHEERLHPELRAFKKLVKKPYYVECKRLKNKVLSISNDSLVFGMLLHDIDLLTTLIGSNVRKVVANGASLFNTFTDFLNVRLEFENGCVANVSCGNFDSSDEDCIKVYQKNEMLTLNFADYQIRKLIKNDEGIYAESVVNSKSKNQDVIKLELQQFAQTIINRQKMSNEVYQSYQSLRIAHQVIEKLHPSNLFNA
jgi:predicted dehydrogenase